MSIISPKANATESDGMHDDAIVLYSDVSRSTSCWECGQFQEWSRRFVFPGHQQVGSTCCCCCSQWELDVDLLWRTCGSVCICFGHAADHIFSLLSKEAIFWRLASFTGYAPQANSYYFVTNLQILDLFMEMINCRAQQDWVLVVDRYWDRFYAKGFCLRSGLGLVLGFKKDKKVDRISRFSPKKLLRRTFTDRRENKIDKNRQKNPHSGKPKPTFLKTVCRLVLGIEKTDRFRFSAGL